MSLTTVKPASSGYPRAVPSCPARSIRPGSSSASWLAAHSTAYPDRFGRTGPRRDGEAQERLPSCDERSDCVLSDGTGQVAANPSLSRSKHHVARPDRLLSVASPPGADRVRGVSRPGPCRLHRAQHRGVPRSRAPIIEIIAQRPGQSPEEMERYVTIPIEMVT